LGGQQNVYIEQHALVSDWWQPTAADCDEIADSALSIFMFSCSFIAVRVLHSVLHSLEVGV
jgi:hypothetical protein